MIIEQNLFTPEQVAGFLQVHVLTVYSYIRMGKMDAVRLGRRYRISAQDLENFVRMNRTRIGPTGLK